jgi:hypothetical protein
VAAGKKARGHIIVVAHATAAPLFAAAAWR